MLIAVGLTGSIAAALGVYAWHIRSRWLQSERTRRKAFTDMEALHNAFTRFVPSAVVDEIVARGVAVGAEKKEVTVLFADLKGFTAMSEALDPSILVDVLNGYFRVATAAITEHHGHVSKFMGDGFMALFGALEPNPWQARDAVNAALAIRDAVSGYNDDLADRGRPKLEIGIGIHCGEVVAGVVGSAQLMEYTVLGDVVNVASRVEQLTREHAVEILVTGAVHDELDECYRCRALPPVPVKGKRDPVSTYAVAARVDLHEI